MANKNIKRTIVLVMVFSVLLSFNAAALLKTSYDANKLDSFGLKNVKPASSGLGSLITAEWYLGQININGKDMKKAYGTVMVGGKISFSGSGTSQKMKIEKDGGQAFLAVLNHDKTRMVHWLRADVIDVDFATILSGSLINAYAGQDKGYLIYPITELKAEGWGKPIYYQEHFVTCDGSCRMFLRSRGSLNPLLDVKGKAKAVSLKGWKDSQKTESRMKARARWVSGWKNVLALKDVKSVDFFNHPTKDYFFVYPDTRTKGKLAWDLNAELPSSVSSLEKLKGKYGRIWLGIGDSGQVLGTRATGKPFYALNTKDKLSNPVLYPNVPMILYTNGLTFKDSSGRFVEFTGNNLAVIKLESYAPSTNPKPKCYKGFDRYSCVVYNRKARKVLVRSVAGATADIFGQPNPASTGVIGVYADTGWVYPKLYPKMPENEKKIWKNGGGAFHTVYIDGLLGIQGNKINKINKQRGIITVYGIRRSLVFSKKKGNVLATALKSNYGRTLDERGENIVREAPLRTYAAVYSRIMVSDGTRFQPYSCAYNDDDGSEGFCLLGGKVVKEGFSRNKWLNLQF